MPRIRLLSLIIVAATITVAGLLLWHPANALEFGLKGSLLFGGGLLFGKLVSRLIARAA